jgi:hypothetical protein
MKIFQMYHFRVMSLLIFVALFYFNCGQSYLAIYCTLKKITLKKSRQI